MTPPRSILVYVGLDAVGDGLMKLPFLRTLRACFPLAEITWAAGKGHTVYASSLSPLVRGLAVEVLDQAGFGSKVGELLGPPPLSGRHFDLIIDTQRRLLTSLILRRIPHTSLISAAAGFWLSDRRPARGWNRPASMVGQLMELLRLAAPQGLVSPAALDVGTAERELALDLLPHGPAYVGLAPGAGGKHKCWPLERYVQLARMLAGGGMVPVFLLGPAEGGWMAGIQEQIPDARFPLQQVASVSPMLTIALAQRMAAAVANDSGTGHMLAAADIPLVSLFGPTPAAKFAPAANRLAVIRAQDHGGEAMDLIPLNAVADAVRALL